MIWILGVGWRCCLGFYSRGLGMDCLGSLCSFQSHGARGRLDLDSIYHWLGLDLGIKWWSSLYWLFVLLWFDCLLKFVLCHLSSIWRGCWHSSSVRIWHEMTVTQRIEKRNGSRSTASVLNIFELYHIM